MGLLFDGISSERELRGDVLGGDGDLRCCLHLSMHAEDDGDIAASSRGRRMLLGRKGQRQFQIHGIHPVVFFGEICESMPKGSNSILAVVPKVHNLSIVILDLCATCCCMCCLNKPAGLLLASRCPTVKVNADDGEPKVAWDAILVLRRLTIKYVLIGSK